MISTTLLPPAPRGPGGPHPLVPLAFIAGFLAGLFPALIAPPARAEDGPDVDGYRITVQACHLGDCRGVKVPPSRWPGKYACQGRASEIAKAAAAKGPRAFKLPPGGWAFSASCEPILAPRRA